MKRFSNREEKIIKIVGRKKMTLEEISEKLFGRVRPFNSGILVSNSVRTIIKKCRYYNHKWTLIKTREANRLHIKRSKIC